MRARSDETPPFEETLASILELAQGLGFEPGVGGFRAWESSGNTWYLNLDPRSGEEHLATRGSVTQRVDLLVDQIGFQGTAKRLEGEDTKWSAYRGRATIWISVFIDDMLTDDAVEPDSRSWCAHLEILANRPSLSGLTWGPRRETT